MMIEADRGGDAGSRRDNNSAAAVGKERIRDNSVPSHLNPYYALDEDFKVKHSTAREQTGGYYAES